MRSIFFIPPLKKMTGGLAVIYETGAALKKLGHNVAFCAPDPNTAGLAAALEQIKSIELMAWPQPDFHAGDIWVVPEGWPNAFAPGLKANIPTVVYIQNWMYTMTALPPGVRLKHFNLTHIAVSRPVDWFARECLGLETFGILPPAVAPCFYKNAKSPGTPNRIRIAWMPRKNKALAEQIRMIFENAMEQEAEAPKVDWVEIHGLARPQVAELLSSAHLFLSTGFPEGFALPPLEAMASGCVPCGFTGLGGWEYMRNHPQTSVSHTPPMPLESQPWGANGFYFADGDVLGAALGLKMAALMAWRNTAEWQDLVKNVTLTANAYTSSNFETRLGTLWKRLEEHLGFK